MDARARLVRFLETSGKTRVEFAVSLGVSPSTLHYWLHGSVPRDAIRRRIAKLTKGAVPADSWESVAA